jgi:hypothetical protein
MPTKYIRLTLKNKLHAVCDIKSLVVDSPNRYGGIGEISFIPIEVIWTGDTHIICDGRISAQFSDLTELEESFDYISDEVPWDTIFIHHTIPFSYEYWKEVATYIKEFILRGNEKTYDIED